MTMTVLFTGYAPVHFLCFRPLYDRLRAMPGVEVLLSGGLRTGSKGNFSYDGPGLYRRFGVPEARILPVGDLAKRPFDIAFAANRRVLASRENIGASIQIFHGVSFRNRGIRAENLEFDHLFLIGPYMSRKFAELGLLDADDPRGLHIGFPRPTPSSPPRESSTGSSCWPATASPATGRCCSTRPRVRPATRWRP